MDMYSQGFKIHFNPVIFRWVIICLLDVFIQNNNKSEFSSGFQSKLQTACFSNVILAAAAATSLRNSVPSDMDM